MCCIHCMSPPPPFLLSLQAMKYVLVFNHHYAIPGRIKSLFIRPGIFTVNWVWDLQAELLFQPGFTIYLYFPKTLSFKIFLFSTWYLYASFNLVKFSLYTGLVLNLCILCILYTCRIFLKYWARFELKHFFASFILLQIISNF